MPICLSRSPAGNNSQGARDFSSSITIAQSFVEFVGDVAPREHASYPWRQGNNRALRLNIMIRCHLQARAGAKRLLDSTQIRSAPNPVCQLHEPPSLWHKVSV